MFLLSAFKFQQYTRHLSKKDNYNFFVSKLVILSPLGCDLLRVCAIFTSPYYLIRRIAKNVFYLCFEKGMVFHLG